MNSLLNVPCSKCRALTPGLNKELLGYFLLIIAIPFIFFDVTPVSALFFMSFIGVGFYWVVTKPSKKVVCDVCSPENKQTA